MEGIITSSFGSRINPVLNKEEFHNGVDIAAEEGTEVWAVEDGVIEKVRNSSTYGNVVEYQTSGGLQVMYGHLKQALVIEGQSVRKGQAVALVGKTGLVTGPHLHYSVSKNGVLLDPLEFLDLRYTEEVEQEYLARGESLR